MSCAPCGATVSLAVPACCAFNEVYSHSRAFVGLSPHDLPSAQAEFGQRAAALGPSHAYGFPIRAARLRHAPSPYPPCPVLTTCRAARLKLLAYKQRKPPPRILCSALRFACRTPRSSTTFVFTRLISRQAARAVRRALPRPLLTAFFVLPLEFAFSFDETFFFLFQMDIVGKVL